jgi:hypothetical protein
MAIGTADLTAAPSDFDVNGKKLKLYPLRCKNWGGIERWIQDEIMLRAERTIKNDTSLDRQRQQAILSAANEAAGAVNVINTILIGGKTPLTTLEGMLRMIQQSVNIGQQMTLDELEVLFKGDVMLIMDAYSKVRSLSFPALFNETEKVGQSENPTPASP